MNYCFCTWSGDFLLLLFLISQSILKVSNEETAAMQELMRIHACFSGSILLEKTSH